MKKTLIVALVVVMMITATLGLTGCTQNLKMGKEMLKYKSQLDAVVQLDAGTVDAVVIDSVMAGYYAATGDYAGKIAIVPNLVLAQEEYGIAGRKEDKAFMSKINEALIGLTALGMVDEIAEEYGLTESLAIKDDAEDTYADATDNSWEAIKTSGKVVIGITIFAPIAYYNGEQTVENLVGFDIELAKSAIAYINTAYELDLAIEFAIIDWNSKEALLENGTIDLVWNGMTITPQLASDMCISIPYLYNKQVAVVAADKVGEYSDIASFADAVIGVEAGSAGEGVVADK
ncbi:MAG: transporter substrate-binding domain-containing protein [Clostridiales bacterium]|nr:transporter substrate-binding domain-containing protein [Clostridiales bacterium]